MFSSEDDAFEELLLSGAIEICGIDEKSGEMLFRFTDKLKDLDPRLYDKMTEFFHKELLALWEKGFISMDVTEKNPSISLTDKALNAIETESLTIDQRLHLEDIVKKLSE